VVECEYEVERTEDPMKNFGEMDAPVKNSQNESHWNWNFLREFGAMTYDLSA